MNHSQNRNKNIKFKKQQRADRNARIARLIIAIVLALFLWVYINGNSIDLVTQDVTNIPVKITGVSQLSGRGLTISGNKKYYVNIRMRGSEQNLRAVDTSGITASADVSGFTAAGTVSPEVVIQGLPNTVILDARRPENLTLNLVADTEKRHAVKVNTSGKPAENLAVLSASTDGKVTLIGPTADINAVAKVVATVNVDGITADTDAYTNVVCYDENGKEVSGVRCRPDKVLTKVRVGQTKKVRVTAPATTGSVADGYNLKNVRVTPKTVTVGGSASTLSSLTSLKTGTIDIDGASDSVTKRLTLTLPDGVTLLESSKKVTATAVIEPERN